MQQSFRLRLYAKHVNWHCRNDLVARIKCTHLDRSMLCRNVNRQPFFVATGLLKDFIILLSGFGLWITGNISSVLKIMSCSSVGISINKNVKGLQYKKKWDTFKVRDFRGPESIRDFTGVSYLHCRSGPCILFWSSHTPAPHPPLSMYHHSHMGSRCTTLLTPGAP